MFSSDLEFRTLDKIHKSSNFEYSSVLQESGLRRLCVVLLVSRNETYTPLRQFESDHTMLARTMTGLFNQTSLSDAK